MRVLAATAPQGFAGIPWGATASEVRDSLTGKGAKLDNKNSDAGRHVFTGGTLGGEPVEQWTLLYVDGRLSKAQVRFGGKNAEDRYRRLKDILNGKYGTGSGAQVGHRKPPHFVLGLGWRSSGSRPPAMHSEWEVESGLDRRTVEIQLWVNKGNVHLAYLTEANEHDAKSTAQPGGKAADF
jgi:hypothetical protein